MGMPESKQPPAPRFDRNDLVYWAGLALLFLGVGFIYGLFWAMLVLGTILTSVSIATSFFITWLAVTVKEKK
jgi:hypothetical protein